MSPALRALVDWYIENGVDGLFASCQSSEIFNMDFEERMRIARITVNQARGRVPVVASGFTDYDLEEQVRSIRAMADTGVDAVILLSNRLALEDEADSVLLARMHALLDRIPKDIPLGLYECPQPYKRLLSLPVLKEAAATGRFHFLKDTCCDAKMIEERVKALAGSPLEAVQRQHHYPAPVPQGRGARLFRHHGQLPPPALCGSPATSTIPTPIWCRPC